MRLLFFIFLCIFVFVGLTVKTNVIEIMFISNVAVSDVRPNNKCLSNAC